MFTLKTLSFAAAILCLSSIVADANTVLQCSRRSDLVKILNSKYSEQLSGFGVSGQQNIVEVFVSESGSWTILMSNTIGVSCIIAAGQSWERQAPKKRVTEL
jgi:predicted methyltransferase